MFFHVLLLLVLVFKNTCEAVFYLPGVSPRDFGVGDPIDVMVNRIDSVRTQLPYRYYALNFCRPDKIRNKEENLGETLQGDDIETAPVRFKMFEDERCAEICTMKNSEKDLKKFRKMVEEEYRSQWIVDNLPVGQRMYYDDEVTGEEEFMFKRGFPIGVYSYDIDRTTKFESSAESIPKSARNVRPLIFNHLSFKILYHSEDTTPSPDTARIVGFEVIPNSVHHKRGRNGALSTCTASGDLVENFRFQDLSDKYGKEIVYTYDVVFERSDTLWSSRWDIYLKQGNNEVHWISIINSTLLVLFLSGMVAMIMIRTLYKDIKYYNAIYEKLSMVEKGGDDLEDALEETGWKLVHADVFRPPSRFPLLLSTMTGTGVQLLAMIYLLLVFAVLGFLSPANRGSLLTCLLLLFIFMGVVGGYVSARVYKMMDGKKWRRNTLLTATLFPGFLGMVSFFVNFFLWNKHSTKAIPFTTMLAVLLLWVGISLPLTYLGAFFGYRKDKIEAPVAINSIPRFIPPQRITLKWYVTMTISGLLQFGCIFIEVYFIMSAIWLHQVYYLFGFAFFVLTILCVACFELSIVITYFVLNSENYKWWWQSFLCGGAVAFYVFLYAVRFHAELDLDTPIASLLYFSSMVQVAFTIFLVTGSVGFLSSLWFTRLIYSSIKVD